MRGIAAMGLGVVALAAAPVPAVERLDGYFIAFEECEAFQSKNKETNPGDVLTEPFRAYEMIALNAPGGDFFQVRVPGAPVTEDRWVHVGCGLHVVTAGTRRRRRRRTIRWSRRPARRSAEHVLALSWQPAFCEYRPEQGRVPRPQRRQPAGDRDAAVAARPLAAAGGQRLLRRAGGAGRARQGVAVGRPARGRRSTPRPASRSTVAMPGTASFLERHEWIKHGTCYRGGRRGGRVLRRHAAAGGRDQRLAGGGAPRRARRRRAARPPSSAPASTRPSGRAPASGCRCTAPATAAGR